MIDLWLCAGPPGNPPSRIPAGYSRENLQMLLIFVRNFESLLSWKLFLLLFSNRKSPFTSYWTSLIIGLSVHLVLFAISVIHRHWYVISSLTFCLPQVFQMTILINLHLYTGCVGGIFITGIFRNFYTKWGGVLTSRMLIPGGPGVCIIALFNITVMVNVAVCMCSLTRVRYEAKNSLY